MPARLVLLGALAVFAIAACSAATPAASPTPVPDQSEAPAATPAPTDAPTATPVATPSPSTAVAPAPPTGVKVTEKFSDPHNMGYATDVKITVSWKHPAPKGVTIRVFGVTACLRPTTDIEQPCLAKNTPLPADVRDLLAKAPASKGSVSWTWPNWEVDVGVGIHGGTTYFSYVIAAYNAAGHSRFVIAETSKYCPTCTY